MSDTTEKRLAELIKTKPNSCEPECEGRCKVCPSDWEEDALKLCRELIALCREERKAGFEEAITAVKGTIQNLCDDVNATYAGKSTVYWFERVTIALTTRILALAPHTTEGD
jgi:hypothetical protein